MSLKEKVKYKSKQGILLNVNCMELFKSLSDESVDLIVTDPPL